MSDLTRDDLSDFPYVVPGRHTGQHDTGTCQECATWEMGNATAPTEAHSTAPEPYRPQGAVIVNRGSW